jgi:protein misato
VERVYVQDNAVLEESFRLFAEECDLLQVCLLLHIACADFSTVARRGIYVRQGVQLCLDAPSFGSFTVSFLSQFRDEYPKLPLLSFCSLSRHDPAEVNLDDVRCICLESILS